MKSVGLPVAVGIDGRALTGQRESLLGNGVLMGLGPELLVNGGFDTDTIWVKGLSWTIAAGAASVSAPAAASRLYQSLPLVAGATYRVEFTVSGYVGGAITIRATNGGTAGQLFASAIADGTYSSNTTLASAAAEFSIVAPNTSAIYSIDSVSLRQVL